MINYLEQQDGSLGDGSKSGLYVGHRLHSQALQKVADGLANIESWAGSQRELGKQASDSMDASKAATAKAKRDGILFEGAMCSATAEDQHGLADVESFILGGQSVNFKFENGNSFVLTAANWAEFRGTWVAFRFSFFPLP